MADIKKVLIVGGGIGGQSAAIALAQAGVEVEIAEIKAEFNVYGVGIIQQANALQALDRIGLADEAMLRGFPYGQIEMHTASGHFIAKAGPPPIGKYPSHNGISRRALHELMYDTAMELGVTYKMGITVDEMENTDDGVKVTFTDGSKGAYDLLIASDGIYSKMREKIFKRMEVRYVGLSVWRYAFPKHPDIGDGKIYYGKRSKIGFVPMSDTTMYMFLVSAEGDDPTLEKEQLVPIYKEYLTEFPAKIAQDAMEQITDPDLVNYRPLQAIRIQDPWYVDNAIVIGDAAHATIPQLGSGAALAIEDAVVLAEELLSAPTIQSAFEKFMKRRYERCMAVVDASELLGEWELMEFNGQALPEGANIGAVMGQTIGRLMQPF